MTDYLLVPGRLPGLSLVEVEACDYDVKLAGSGVFLVSAEQTAAEIQERLGGVVKIAEVVEALPRTSQPADFVEPLEKLLPRTGKKYSWGISVVDGGVSQRTLLKWQHEMHRVGLSVKKLLSADGQSTRLVVSREATLSSAALLQSNIMRDGHEFVLALFPDQIIVGETRVVQNLDEYTRRDVGRPARHVRRGMLPVKVAQIMVNLAQVPAGGIVLDPFCGVGTILQEARRLGFAVSGSDRDEKAVEAARKNLEWYSTRFPSSSTEGEGKGGDRISIPHLPPAGGSPFLLKEGGKNMVKECLVENLSTCWASQKFDAIIAEPDLGPIHPEQWNDTARERLQKLYETAFREFVRVLKPGGTVVFLFPVTGRQKKQFMPDALFKNIFALGFEQAPLLAKQFGNSPWVSLTKRQTLVYSRPEQFVGREIVVFKMTTPNGQ